MPDLSQVSTEDLMAFRDGRLQDVTTEGLMAMRGLSSPAQTHKEDGILSRIGEDFERRKDIVREKRAEFERGEIPAAMVGSKAVTQAGAFLTDVLGESVIGAGKAVAGAAGELIPEEIKEPVSRAARSFLESNIGKEIGETGEGVLDVGVTALQKGGKIWSDFKKSNPNASSVIEDMANAGLFLSVFAPVKKVPIKKADEPFVTLGKAGEKISKSGVKQQVKNRRSFINDLVREQETPSFVQSEIIKGKVAETPILRKRVFKQSVFEKQMAREVSRIKGVSPYKSGVANANLIRDEYIKTIEGLTKSLEKKGITFPRKEIKSRAGVIIQDLLDNPLLLSESGNLLPTAQKAIRVFEDALDKFPSTPSGVLKARRFFDDQVEKFKPNIFDAKSSDAYKETVFSLRNLANDFVAEKAPDVATKRALRRYHLLRTAQENIAEKAAKRGSNAVRRAMQKVEGNVSLKELVALAGLGGVGALTQSMPVTLGAGVVYYGGKAMTGPTAKKFLGEILKGTDKALKTIKDKGVIQELRADRAVIAEFIKTIPNKELDVEDFPDNSGEDFTEQYSPDDL